MNQLINIEEAVYRFPLSLRGIKNEVLINAINNFLPYSTGFEIECFQKEHFDSQAFLKIANIIDVDCDEGEQRFRIPNGIDGLICLYEITKNLKVQSELNEGSGIHYHVDMTDCYDLLTEEFIEEHSEYVLKELESWKYDGTYNAKKCEFSELRYWTRFKNSTKTMEFRIGEMTFDYNLLVTRIIHCNEIVRYLKEVLYKTPNEMRIKRMALQLAQLNKIPVINSEPDQYQMNSIINNRTIKLNGTK